MSAANAKCKGCGSVLPELGYHGFAPHEHCGFAFCARSCAEKWSYTEAARSRGWLSRIAAKTRGIAADLATQALYSNYPADWGDRKARS